MKGNGDLTPSPTQKAVRRKRITPAQVERGLAAMAASPIPLTRTALSKIMKVSRDTVRKWEARMQALVAAYREVKGTDYIERLWAAESAYLTALADPETVEKTPVRDRGIVFGILNERRRLEAGLATSHVEVHTIREEMQSREQMIRRLRDLGILDTVLDVTPPKEELPNA